MVRTTFSEHDIGIVLQSGLFDEDHYRATSGQEGLSLSELVLHYLTVGWLQGHDPSCSFIQMPYLAAHPDVLEARANPLFHYLMGGKAEGRTTFMDLPAVWPKTPVTNDPPSDLQFWNPLLPALAKTTLILVVGGSDEEVSATLTSLGGISADFDVLNFKSSGKVDINTEIVQGIAAHGQVHGAYEEIAVVSGGDTLEPGWLAALQEERAKFPTLAVGAEQSLKQGAIRISGYRSTGDGYVRPIRRQTGTPICAQSLPVHLVSMRGALVDVAQLQVLARSKEPANPTWAHLCMETWVIGAPCRVAVKALVKQSDYLRDIGPLSSLRIRLPEASLVADSPSDLNHWFASSARSNEHGAQRVRLLGNLQRDLLGNPLALAAITAVEEFGMNLVVAIEPHKKDVEETTVGDVLVTTTYEVEHTERPGIRGRRQAEFVVSGVCRCQTSTCSSPTFSVSQSKSKNHNMLNEYWNLRRLITVSCGSESQAESHAALRRGLLAIGFRPTATFNANHGSHHG